MYKRQNNPLAKTERDKFEQTIHLFRRFGEEYQFDPLALAAQGYQESRLDQSLTSHMGAIGVMQLLQSTANDPNVGIPNIDDVENNIHAGAKYMNFLRNRYFQMTLSHLPINVCLLGPHTMPDPQISVVLELPLCETGWIQTSGSITSNIWRLARLAGNLSNTWQTSINTIQPIE